MIDSESMVDEHIPDTDFRKGEIIWAKIAGYPWWPGQIIDYDEVEDGYRFTINFIGDKSHAYLSRDKISKYKENRETYCKTKKKHLIDAISKADEMVDKVVPIGWTSLSTESPKKVVKKKRKESATTKSTPAPEKTIKSLDDAKNWLEEFVNSDKIASNDILKKNVALTLTIIRSKVTTHKLILDTKIGINLNKLMQICLTHTELNNLVEAVSRTLKKLKGIVRNVYFGPKLNRDKQKKSIEKLKAVEEIKIPSPEIIKPIVEKITINEMDDNQSVAESTPISKKDAGLKINICHVIAKFIEEKTSFSKEESQQKTIKIEEKLREIDPTMGVKYQEHAVWIINMLKETKQTIKTQDFDELVNKTISYNEGV